MVNVIIRNIKKEKKELDKMPEEKKPFGSLPVTAKQVLKLPNKCDNCGTSAIDTNLMNGKTFIWKLDVPRTLTGDNKDFRPMRVVICPSCGHLYARED